MPIQQPYTCFIYLYTSLGQCLAKGSLRKYLMHKREGKKEQKPPSGSREMALTLQIPCKGNRCTVLSTARGGGRPCTSLAPQTHAHSGVERCWGGHGAPRMRPVTFTGRPSASDPRSRLAPVSNCSSRQTFLTRHKKATRRKEHGDRINLNSHAKLFQFSNNLCNCCK